MGSRSDGPTRAFSRLLRLAASARRRAWRGLKAARAAGWRSPRWAASGAAPWRCAATPTSSLVVDSSRVDGRDAAAFAEALLYPLWDATLAVGHQVLSVADARAARAGGPRDGDRAARPARARGRRGAAARRSSRARTRASSARRRSARSSTASTPRPTARHERFGGSVYLLEPDVKSGAGGLRDLDGARWAARARYRITHGDGDTKLGAWGELVRLGVLVGREAQEFAASEEFLWRVRNRLHARAGRKADRLGFEEQEALAVAMGYGADRALAAERLMQDYYLHARTVTRARASLLERLRPMRRRTKAAAHDRPRQGRPALRRPRDDRRGAGAARRSGARAARLRGVRAARGARPAVRARRDHADGGRPGVVRAAASRAPRRRASSSSSCARCRRRARGAGRSSASCTTSGLLLAMVPEFLPVTGPRAPRHLPRVHGRRSLGGRRSIASASSRAASSRTSSRSRRGSPPRSRARGRSFSRRSFTTSARDGRTPTARGRTTRRRAPTSATRILPRLGLGSEDVDEARAARPAAPPHVPRRHAPRPRRPGDHRGVLPRRARARGPAQSVPPDGVGPVDDVADGDDVVEGADARRALLRGGGAPRRAGAARGRRARRARARRRARAPGRGRPSRSRRSSRRCPSGTCSRTRPSRSSQHARVVAERGDARGARRPGDLAPPEAAELCVVADDRPGCSRASRPRSPRAGSRCSRRRCTRATDRRSRRGGRRLLGARSRRRDRRGRGCDAAARARPRGRVLAAGRPGRAPARAHGLDLALARAAEPRGARRRSARRPRVAAPHGRRGLRQGPARVCSSPCRTRFTSSACRSRSRRSTPRGPGSPTSSTWASSTAPRSRAGRGTTRSTRRWCAPSRAEDRSPLPAPRRRWEDEGMHENLADRAGWQSRGRAPRVRRVGAARADGWRRRSPRRSLARQPGRGRRPRPPEPPPRRPTSRPGIRAFDAGNYADARKSFEAAAKKNPNDYEALSTWA